MAAPRPAPSPSPERAFDSLDLRQARARLLLAIAAGVGTSLALALVPGAPGWTVRLVAGWDAGAVAFTVLAWAIILRSNVVRTRKRAAAQDPGRSAVWGTVLVASTVSLFAAVAVLRRAKTLAPTETASLVVLCLAAVVAAWTLTHTAYTLRYAHLYYREDDGDGEGGLCFPGGASPCYFDFAYFAFTVGMCFQVSDVTITSPAIRRAVLGHSLLSFAYNTAILALALNLTFGLLG
jgi:uncharacterized membrane protein